MGINNKWGDTEIRQHKKGVYVWCHQEALDDPGIPSSSRILWLPTTTFKEVKVSYTEFVLTKLC